MTTEPVAIAAAVRAVLIAVMAFGVGLTAVQVAAVAIAVELVAALFVRARVVPADPNSIWVGEKASPALAALLRDAGGEDV
jgi:hypothetical protein